MVDKKHMTDIRSIGVLQIQVFSHPQGCRGYLIADAASKDALALDVHLDFVHDMSEQVKSRGWKLLYVVDSHTHADHPSGSHDLAMTCNATRVAHEKGGHVGVTLHPKDGDTIQLGETPVTIRHAPGHTPDHMVLLAEGVIFSGDSLHIGGVARTDFLGGNAGLMFDSIHALAETLPDNTILFPGHDYQNRIESTLGKEKMDNPWLRMGSRAEFIKNLTANPPPKPANMDALLHLNREAVDIAATLPASEVLKRVAAGGAASVIDVRTGAEFKSTHIAGSRLIPLDQVEARVDEIRAAPVPRLLLCQTGMRATSAMKTLEKLHVTGLSVVEGGIVAYARVGGKTVKGKAHISVDRQVRIAAGSLILLGVFLGLLLNPRFFGLAAFVGAGLVFAGITDICGMAFLLARMPWNRSDDGQGLPSGGGNCSSSIPPACSAAVPPTAGCSSPPPGTRG
jgi:glyoxylase-like metal-dependent hydrolase (beta-lactamase superfamily II)/rhodanese-related sulfurtransferase